jgi:hypothetical protein
MTCKATDEQLLEDYRINRSEVAFAELVRRYTDLVYSAAWPREVSTIPVGFRDPVPIDHENDR